MVALAIALSVHLGVVLGADSFRSGLLRFRTALGLAPPAVERTAQPRDDDWIRIVFDRSDRPDRPDRPDQSLRAVTPVRAPPVRPPPVRPPSHGGPKALPRQSRLVASLTHPSTGLVKPPTVGAKPGSAEPPPGWLDMRGRNKGSAPPGIAGARRRRRRRRLDLVYRPAPGELRVGAVDKGRLRVAGRDRAVPEETSGPVHGTGRWTPIPARLLVSKARPSGGFHVDGRSRPMYAGVKIKRLGRGRWRYHGPKCTFNATIHPDGQVTFRDLPSIALGKVRGVPPLRIPGDSQSRAFSGIVLGVSFTFDLTDAVMRGIGQDPYSAEKLRFARLTRPWRLGLRARFQRRVRRAALARFGPQAGLCRRYRGLDAGGRLRTRRWLFARWDETREDCRGKPLRAAVMAAIRRCAIRYPLAELARLNAGRRSRSRGREMTHFRP